METREIIVYPVYNETNIYITRDNIKKILKKGGLRRDIQNFEIFQQAFVHESYCVHSDFVKYEKYFGRLEPYDENSGIVPLQDKTSERLEWLGDSILQSVMGNYLYRRYPDQQEGFLTKLRSKLVKTETLSKLSKYLGLEKYIIMSKQKEIIGGGRTDERTLEDAFEALIGAISIEYGVEDELEGIRACRTFIIKVFEDVVDFTELILKDDNYKDQLMRYFHRMYDNKYTPIYEVKQIEMLENEKGYVTRKYHILVRDRDGLIVGEASSFMKKEAEVKAAKAALNYYGIMDGF